MLNLFRKTKQVAKAVKQSFETPKDPNLIVAEIHEAFDTATDKLLAEAKAVLAGEYDIQKGERLKNIGFVQAKKAVEANMVVKEKSESQALAQRIEYFKIYYPNNKFITEDKVKEICQKYGLLKAGVKHYISDVPEKNLSEIENFKLRKEDMERYECNWYHHKGGGYFMICDKNEPNAFYGSLRWGIRSYIIDHAEEGTEANYITPPFEICASVKDFNTKDTHIEDGYKLSVNIPDPIVLQPVAGGYLVVSKWGLEGQDESLINEIKN